MTGPDGQKWENYVVLADAGADLEGKTFADVEGIQRNPDAADFGVATGGGCCGTPADADAAADPKAGVCYAN